MTGPSADRLLDAAVERHRQGRLAEADTLYARVLALEPAHPDALHLSGLIARQAGRPDAALARIARSIAQRPGFAPAQFNLGNILRGLGRDAEALACYRACVRAEPDNADALLNLAILRHRGGDAAGAAAAYRAVLALRPGEVDAHSNLGAALRAAGRGEEAAPCYRRALALQPAAVGALSNLSSLCRDLGDLDGAEACARRAIALEPGFGGACANLGNIHYSRSAFEEAESLYRRTLLLDSASAEVHGNRGTVLQSLGRLTEAVASHRRAVAFEPSDPQGCNRLGVALQMVGGPEAVTAFDRCLALTPGDGTAVWHRSLARLGVGDLEGGWRDYETGFASGFRSFLSELPFPVWDGGDLAGRTLLIRREQGIGDELMFTSCLPDLVARARTCVLECSPRLKALFRRSFPDAVVVETDGLPAVLETLARDGRAPDVQIGLASLPSRLRTSLDRFPTSAAGHLRADPAATAAWRARLDAHGPGLKIGIGWRSRLVYGKDYHLYSQDLHDWREILGIPGTVFVSLQYDPSEEELDGVRRELGARIVSFPELDLTNDLDGAAALTAACDLVISTASAVAVMAGSLGRPVWEMTLPADWRQLGTPGYPWLPAMECLVRHWGEDWRRVLGEVAARLRRRVGQGGGPA